jgi:hypothetical protein
MSLLSDNVKHFLLTLINRKFLTFLFCFALSGFFWLLLTLNETVTKELQVPVTITNVTDDYHLISDEVMNVTVTMSGQGLSLLGSVRGMSEREASVNFSELVKKADQDQGVATISETELLTLVRKKIGNVKVTDMKPRELKIYFTKGNAVKVPVRLNDPRIVAKEHYFVVKTEVEPDSVMVYAIKPLTKAIKSVEINYFMLDEEKEGTEKKVRMPYKTGVKYSPKEVTVKVTTDLLVEDTMRVRIKVPDFADNTILRTFPPSVTVRYTVPVSRKKDAKSTGFIVEPVMDQVVLHEDSVVDLVVREFPPFVLNPRLEVKKVGYLLERR